jgi:hypothetical protein
MQKPTLKGKGREIFFPDPDSTTPRHPDGTTPSRRVKTTFWLTEELVHSLDRAWLERRAQDPKTTKSQIAEEALRKFLGR